MMVLQIIGLAASLRSLQTTASVNSWFNEVFADDKQLRKKVQQRHCERKITLDNLVTIIIVDGGIIKELV